MTTRASSGLFAKWDRDISDGDGLCVDGKVGKDPRAGKLSMR